MLGAALALFGGVYVWAAAILTIAVLWLAVWIRPAPAPGGWLGILDLSLAAVLAIITLQLIPLPSGVVALVSPGRLAFERVTSLATAAPAFLPLTLNPRETLHALMAAFCTTATFLIARTLFARGGIRTVITAVAWIAVAFVLIAVAQGAASTPLVYGFWEPVGQGARPMGPFINRNHGGTWSLLALMLCVGCVQWRRTSTVPPHGWSWRHRLAHAVGGRSVILVLAVVLLIVNIALGASRSTMLALVGAASYVAWTASRDTDGRSRSGWMVGLGVLAALALLAYADLDRLLSRLDQTRRVGFSTRLAIWRDTLGVVRDFPVAGVGAGNFSNAMRLYQTSDRTYFWNEAHNQYLQVAAEGGVLLVAPAACGVLALTICGWRAVRQQTDPIRWMRIGAFAALLAVAIQGLWETGLSLPANGMLAAVAAAILVHEPRHRSHAPRN